MNEDGDMSFLTVTDLSTLSREEMDRRNAYWLSRLFEERWHEIARLNRAKWGDEVSDRGMDKTHFEVIDISQYR